MKIFFSFICSLITALAYGGPLNLLDIDVTVRQVAANASQSVIHNTLTLPANNRWVLLSGFQSLQTITHQPTLQNQSLILMKISKATMNKALLHFLFISHESNQNSILEKTLKVIYRQKGEIKLQEKNQTINLSILAKPSDQSNLPH